MLLSGVRPITLEEMNAESKKLQRPRLVPTTSNATEGTMINDGKRNYT